MHRRELLLAGLLTPFSGLVAAEELVRGGVLPSGMAYRLVRWPGLRKARVQLAYGSGSRHDPENLQGLSHLLEHAMFKADYAPGVSYDAWFRSRGLEGFAHTTQDATVFYSDIATANILDVLKLEASRMQELRLTQEVLQAEIGVVQAEIAAKSAEFLEEQALTTLTLSQTTYAQSLAGVPAQVASMTAARVGAHHRQHYAPGNAHLVVIADADLDDMAAWVVAAFGDIRKASPEWATHRQWQRTRARTPGFYPPNAQHLVISWDGARLWEERLTDYWQEWVPRVLGEAAKPWTLSYEHAGKQVVVVPLKQGAPAAQARAIQEKLVAGASMSEAVSLGMDKALELARRLRRQQPSYVAEVALQDWLAQRSPGPVRPGPVPDTVRALVASPFQVFVR